MYETIENRISNERLRRLCTNNKWFTEGTNSQYEKLFEMNENGASISNIATAIWLCSDSEASESCYQDIYSVLLEVAFPER